MPLEKYIEDVDFAESILHTDLFRPPYARVTPSQMRAVGQRYKIIMWNILSRDYTSTISPEECSRGVVKHIEAGSIMGATPDGRLAGEPLSDAASPTYGRDRRGMTAVVASLTKPDYTCVACGSVVNQKFSPSMFEDGKREKLAALLRVYFARGGQEMQINATSREVLMDAMEHPERYPTMVVRVSGYSAIFVTLPKAVQTDILNRTQQA